MRLEGNAALTCLYYAKQHISNGKCSRKGLTDLTGGFLGVLHLLFHLLKKKAYMVFIFGPAHTHQGLNGIESRAPSWSN